MTMQHLIAYCLACFGFVEAASAQLAGGKPLSVATTYSVESDALGGERLISVRLPPEYHSEPKRRFPVVYLLDGGPEQDFVHIAGIAQSRDLNFSFDPFILIGVQSINRRHYFAPPVIDPAPYEEMLSAKPGGSAKYRDYLRLELMPLVESSFRTNGQKAILGESLAGLFVIETLLKEPTLFDDYIAISPSLWWEEMKYGKQAREYLDRHPEGNRRLYLTTASEGDWHREGTERFVSALREGAPKGLGWTFVDSGSTETHGTLFHPMALDAFRVFYGTPGREYRNFPLVGGPKNFERSDADKAQLETECSRSNSLPITPGSAERGREAIYYQCLMYELGPLPREGNLPG